MYFKIYIQFHNFVYLFQTIDSLLCTDVKMIERTDDNNKGSMVAASYQSGRPFKKRQFQRPGISDLL